MKKTNIPLFCCLALALGAAGSAQAQAEFKPYIGAGYGQYKLEFEDGDTDFDDDQDAWRLYGGMHISEAFAAEISLYDFQAASDIDLESDLEGASIAALFNAPIGGEHFGVFLKAGWFFWEAEVESTVPGAPILSEDFEGDDLFYGVGLKFGFNEHVALRVEYDRFELDEEIDPELDYASVNLQFQF